MIENIWTKIWNIVSKNPSKLAMNKCYLNSKVTEIVTLEDIHGIPSDFLEKNLSNSGCIFGLAYIISKQENYPLKSFRFTPYFMCELFGGDHETENMDDCDSLWSKLHTYNNDEALKLIEQRAKEEQTFQECNL